MSHIDPDNYHDGKDHVRKGGQPDDLPHSSMARMGADDQKSFNYYTNNPVEGGIWAIPAVIGGGAALWVCANFPNEATAGVAGYLATVVAGTSDWTRDGWTKSPRTKLVASMMGTAALTVGGIVAGHFIPEGEVLKTIGENANSVSVGVTGLALAAYPKSILKNKTRIAGFIAAAALVIGGTSYIKAGLESENNINLPAAPSSVATAAPVAANTPQP